MKKIVTVKKTEDAGEISNCRCLDLGLEGMAECLQQGPRTCAHALPFGYSFLCSHPRVGEIVSNTQARRTPKRQ